MPFSTAGDACGALAGHPRAKLAESAHTVNFLPTEEVPRATRAPQKTHVYGETRVSGGFPPNSQTNPKSFPDTAAAAPSPSSSLHRRCVDLQWRGRVGRAAAWVEALGGEGGERTRVFGISGERGGRKKE